tara:strand:+ start:962 stop:1603 length:642 start_codon:yes stop_codon:yes gene_type:complete
MPLAPRSNPLTASNTGGEKKKTKDWQARLSSNTRLGRRAVKRKTFNALKVQNAAKHIRELPCPDEVLHCVMRGNYNGFDLVPAIYRLAHRPLLGLSIATLGFNSSNANGLCDMIDAGQVEGRGVILVCSTFYAQEKNSIADQLADELAARGGQLAARQSHAKVIACKTADGNAYVIESSANLRSCNAIEQFTLSNSIDVYNFHRAWLTEICQT